MRWLAILAIVVAGAAVYLVWSMSAGTPPQARASQTRDREVEVRDTEATPDSAAAAPQREARPPVVTKQPAPPAPTAPTAPQPRSIDRSGPIAATVDASEEEIPWTDEQRWQQLFTARGRYEKGNYPGSVEAAMELARRYPPWAEDGWKVAIMAHCAMNESDKANALYAKMTDKPAIEELTKACSGWGIPLTKP